MSAQHPPQIKGYPFEVALPKGLEIEGVVLSDQVKSLDFTVRDLGFICQAGDNVLVHVQKNVLALVGE